MAHLDSRTRTLFFTTSPRTPSKMIPEIKLLIENFEGKPWSNENQVKFARLLIQTSGFDGSGSSSNLDFSARDRITRAPKALGLVDLKPVIRLTDAGENFINALTSDEALLRQLLKFQLPSPYHTETAQTKNRFYVKPYLELFRLIYELESVTFDELLIFGMQLTHYSKFEEVVQKIKDFRIAKSAHTGNYRVFLGNYRDKEIAEIYQAEISQGETRTRESRDVSRAKFIKTKASNMRDYTDACFRYLRATGLVAISQKGKSLSILPEKKDEVRFFLDNIDRKPCFVEDEAAYKEYLFNASLPVLYTDNRENLEQAVQRLNLVDQGKIENITTNELKAVLRHAVDERKQRLIRDEVTRLKTYKAYEDIMDVFDDISDNNFYDVPLMLEWNTWRAMTMLNGGDIKANLKFDDNGQPMSTASGNMADIVCDYGDFFLTVEVTMQSGQRQYETEGEPVSRHLAKVKREQGKEAYCFFIAPRINEACIAHFYTLHLTNIAFYGGKSVIIPLELSTFEKMVEQSGTADYTPTPEQVQKLCHYSMEVAEKVSDEMEWYNAIKERAMNWLVA